ncbi:hypothetical protein ABW21_db0205634 [Orbilia brochopaga]|nr:hypothetical protein ABW21_db0205634 [Drechslerella brochopaga]
MWMPGLFNFTEFSTLISRYGRDQDASVAALYLGDRCGVSWNVRKHDVPVLKRWRLLSDPQVAMANQFPEHSFCLLSSLKFMESLRDISTIVRQEIPKSSMCRGPPVV